MPINATPEYFKAEEKFRSAKTKEEKILALEEMIRTAPKHKGGEHLLADLRGKLAKLKKEAEKKKGAKKEGISKEGDAQVCLLGFTNSGKSTLLKKLTNAEPVISQHKFTTIKPEVGMMDYKGIKIQLVEIPPTFKPGHMSIARTCELICFVIKDEKERRELEKIKEENYIRVKHIFLNPWKEDAGKIKQKIWDSLGLIIAYTKDSKGISPMALPKDATVKDFATRIHKDFVKNFRFAQLLRNGRKMQVGINYPLKHGDILEIHQG